MRVFLSYCSVDRPFVEEFNKVLKALGIETFLDVNDISLGELIPPRVYKELEEANYIFYFISKAFLASNWATRELSYGNMKENAKGSVVVLPILIDDIEKLPALIFDKKYADFRNRKIDLRSNEFQLVLKSLDIDVKQFKKNIAVIGKLNEETIISILTNSAELEIIFNHIVYLTHRAISVKDKNGSRRIVTTNESIVFNNVIDKIGSMVVKISRLSDVELLDPIRKDIIKKVNFFLMTYAKMNELAKNRAYNLKVLVDFLESTIGLNGRLSQLHFQLVVLFFNLKVKSPYN